MELEFDKEIDALLRKARSGTSAAATPKGRHLDADAIAAFAEGAIPVSMRNTYTAHFADCDKCRGILSQVALANEPLAMAAAAARVPAAAPWPPTTVPWYRSLFHLPGLAAAMGVLVIAFGGALVYLVMQRGQNGSTVAMQKAAENANASVPYTGIETNSMSNTTTADNVNTASAAMSNASRFASNTAANASSRNNSTTIDGTDSSANTPAGSATGSAGAQPPAAAPAPSTVVGGAVAGRPEDKTKSEPRERKDDKETNGYRTLDEDSLARGEMSLKKTPGGPSRAQNQVQNNNVQSETVATRRSGGKTFRNEKGVWYDSAYHGQATTNVRRVSNDFKKLDSGLRSIANELGGVVVIVWKDKAYRIQ